MVELMRSLIAILKHWRPPGRLRHCAAAVLAAATAPSAAFAQTSAADSPDALHAAFLFNFAKFTTWPSVSDLDTSIKFCVQEDTIEPSIFAGWGKKRIQNRPVRVAFFDHAGDAQVANCSIMFVRRAPTDMSIQELTRAAAAHSTLLVSDLPGFSKDGGHIELFLVNRRLRFKVNLGELSRADLSLGAGVLNLAEIVATEGQRR